MGCDIHIHGEVKIDGVWYHYNHPCIHRHYALFAKMANVRNRGEITPISDPRGLPTDISFMTRFDRNAWGADGHSDSWLSCEEIEVLAKWYEEEHEKNVDNSDGWFGFEYHLIGYLFGNGWNVKRCPKDYPFGVEDARLVFWFDN